MFVSPMFLAALIVVVAVIAGIASGWVVRSSGKPILGEGVRVVDRTLFADDIRIGPSGGPRIRAGCVNGAGLLMIDDAAGITRIMCSSRRDGTQFVIGNNQGEPHLQVIADDSSVGLLIWDGKKTRPLASCLLRPDGKLVISHLDESADPEL